MATWYYLYQPLIHIPLMLRLPGQTEGRRLAAPVSQVDMAPTLLDLLGLATPPWMDGQSFKNALANGPYHPNPKFAMNLSLWGDPPSFLTKSAAVIQDDYKLIAYLRFQRYEMYQVSRDPEERHDLTAVEPDKFRSLKRALEQVVPQ
jgi:arylsulfatase A-like enzyme